MSPCPAPSNPGKGRDLDKRTRESELMFLPLEKYFHSEVLAFTHPPVKEHINIIKKKYQSKRVERASDRPAQTPRMVLAVTSHDSLGVRFVSFRN